MPMITWCLMPYFRSRCCSKSVAGLVLAPKSGKATMSKVYLLEPKSFKCTECGMPVEEHHWTQSEKRYDVGKEADLLNPEDIEVE